MKKHDHTADDRYDGTQELKVLYAYMYMEFIYKFTGNHTLQAQLEVLTKERDHFREQASQKASAFEKAKEQAKKYEHLCIEVAALKDTADQMKSTCAWYEAENKKLEEMVSCSVLYFMASYVQCVYTSRLKTLKLRKWMQ